MKMTSLDGEYILLGRKSEQLQNIFIHFGQDSAHAVNITGGPGVEEAEFVDGLRFAVQSRDSGKFNVDLNSNLKRPQAQSMDLLSCSP